MRGGDYVAKKKKGKGRDWYGESARHSKAAKKGWGGGLGGKKIKRTTTKLGMLKSGTFA